MKKRWIIICILIVAVVGLLEIYSPIPDIAASKERAAFKAENATLGTAINDLLQTTPNGTRYACETYDQGHWRNKAYCHSYAVYDYQDTAQPGGRAAAITRAKTLETLLRQRGWTNDRPQDPNQTIEATLPTHDMFPYHINSIPMHKNIGPVSCNLRIDAGGTVKTPVINVNDFGCSQHITYYFPHLTRRHHVLI